MIRVVHIAAGLDTGGGELFLERLACSLYRAEFEQHVISVLTIGPAGLRMQAAGINVQALGYRGKAGVLPGLFRVASRLRELRPDLVQGWLYHGNLLAWAALRLARLRCPLLWNVRHSLDQWPQEGFFWRSEIRAGGCLARTADRLVFNSSHAARQHEHLGYPRERACVIPNGFDLEKFAPDETSRAESRRECGIGPDNVALGIVGRYHPLKDHVGFLRAAAILISAVPTARFVLAGRGLSGDNRELAGLIRELGLGSRATLLGERDDIARVMNGFDIYVSSSASEAFPNAVGEAMSCGLPCVVTDVGDSADLVGDTGIVVAPKSPAALAEGLLQLIRVGADRRRELGAAARARIRLKYSIARVAEQYAELYRSVCKKDH